MGIQTNAGLQYVHPTFLYESIADFLIFIVLTKLSKNRKYKGQITYWYFMLYAGIRFFIEGLRQDSLMLGNLRISQLVSLILFVLSVSFLLYFGEKMPKREK